LNVSFALQKNDGATGVTPAPFLEPRRHPGQLPGESAVGRADSSPRLGPDGSSQAGPGCAPNRRSVGWDAPATILRSPRRCSQTRTPHTP
jgi:hypothetical protein